MPNEKLLVRTLVALADNLVDDFDVVELLTLLSDRCVETLDVAAAGVMLAAPSGDLQVVASSSTASRSLELFELQSEDGPCVECYRSGIAVSDPDLSTPDRRWPRFARRAAQDGFRSADSLPMRLRGRTIGALNLFRTSVGGLIDGDVTAAQALADVATIAILQHRTAIDAQALNNQLNEALNSRIVIEQAKGKVSEACGLEMDAAFERLRHHARNHNLRLTELCRDIANGSLVPTDLDFPRR
jgi:GAF domain-containing protein